jgi:hypothetical protein
MLRQANKYQKPPIQQGKSRLSYLLTMLAIVIVAAGLLTNETRLLDWYHLRGYVPPSNVAKLADDTSMSPYARHMFYLNKPQILSSVTSFRRYCPENQDTIVLGCYHSGENGIYVYNVPDPSLAGVQQVTAAHEVLHAAYARLSSHDRAVVDSELMDYFQHGLTDSNVKADIKIYQQTEPSSVTDEMHSLFGTEIANLPAPLQSYYGRYFTSRSKIVAYQQQYQDQFTKRQATIMADDKQLNDLKISIKIDQDGIDSQLAIINSDRARINSYAASNQNASYNAAIPAFNSEIDDYNAAVQKLKDQIDGYNQLVAARNLVAGQLTTLDNALDTRTSKTVSH